MILRIVLISLAAAVSGLSLITFPISISAFAVIYSVIWCLLAFEDARFLSVQIWLLALGVGSGILFITCYWVSLGQLSSLLETFLQSLLFATCLAILGVVFQSLSGKSSLGLADPFAMFAITLPLSHEGVIWLLIMTYPLGLMFQYGRADRSIPLITLMVIGSNVLIIWEILVSNSFQ